VKGVHFQKIMNDDIVKFIGNSLIVAVFSMAVCLTLGSMCAYALSRLKLPGRNIWAVVVLITRMVPAGTLMIPLYVIMRTLRLSNTHLAVILTHATLNLPFTIWMLRSFFDDLPEALEEAAMIDGCSRVKSFVRIALPLCAPGLAATGILAAIYSWNELMFSLILSDNSTRTIPVWISGFISQVSVNWGGSSAATVIACVPIFAAGIFIQKYLVRGLTMGAVKG
jgi:multiple sugar transport system permease protein